MKKIVYTIISLFMFIIALNYLGFVLTTFFFLLFLLTFIAPQKPLKVFLIGSLSAGLSYLIFQLLLRADLPTGVLGF